MSLCYLGTLLYANCNNFMTFPKSSLLVRNYMIVMLLVCKSNTSARFILNIRDSTRKSVSDKTVGGRDNLKSYFVAHRYKICDL